MKLPKFLTALLVGLVMIFASAQSNSQTSVTGTQATHGVYAGSSIEFQVSFSSDSLLNAKTNLFSILAYSEYMSSVSWKATGTTPVFRINAYKTNFNSSDTTYWTLINQWDTTGHYTGKPVNDTLSNALITGTAGLPMRYLAFQVKGLANNREDVVVKIRVEFYRKG